MSSCGQKRVMQHQRGYVYNVRLVNIINSEEKMEKTTVSRGGEGDKRCSNSYIVNRTVYGVGYKEKEAELYRYKRGRQYIQYFPNRRRERREKGGGWRPD